VRRGQAARSVDRRNNTLVRGLEPVAVDSPPSIDHLAQSLKRHRKLVALMVALIIVGSATLNLGFTVYALVKRGPVSSRSWWSPVPSSAQRLSLDCDRY
jgi:hypothetical protein